MGYPEDREVPDELWELIAPILPLDKPEGSPGRPALIIWQALSRTYFTFQSSS
jgi:hypothetical protein